MQMNLVDAENRVWTLHREYCKPLTMAGNADLQVTKPHLAISYIAKKLNTQQLYKRMMNIIELQKNENFHMKNFHRFMGEVAGQAEKMQVEQRAVRPHHKIERRHRHVRHPRSATQQEARRKTVARGSTTGER